MKSNNNIECIDCLIQDCLPDHRLCIPFQLYPLHLPFQPPTHVHTQEKIFPCLHLFSLHSQFAFQEKYNRRMMMSSPARVFYFEYRLVLYQFIILFLPGFTFKLYTIFRGAQGVEERGKWSQRRNYNGSFSRQHEKTFEERKHSLFHFKCP